MLIKEMISMLPEELEKRFKPAVDTARNKKIERFYETDEEKRERIMEQLGIQKHGKGKRKKKNKKKGGKK
jgi:hypothetical protein